MSCFILQNNEISEFNTSAEISPCGPVNATTAAVPCCTNGDACLTGGLCFFTFSLTGGSGYYAAGCTDSSFKDPHCREICCAFDPVVFRRAAYARPYLPPSTYRSLHVARLTHDS